MASCLRQSDPWGPVDGVTHPVLNYTVSPYGADSSGLICGFRLGVDGSGVAVDSPQPLDWMGSMTRVMYW
jgi:hypothetical protein